jgi:ketosteroid isomerase-like protein
MSEENVEIVTAMLAAWAAGDREAARTAWDPDVVWSMPVVDSRVAHGLKATERAIEAWRRSWDEWRLEVDEVSDAGDHVILAGRQIGIGRGSGAEVELRLFGVFSLRNRMIIRAQFFNTRAEADEAAGVSE